MSEPIQFIVDGQPVPKQSYRAVNGGGGYTDPRVKAWQETVSLRAREAMQGREPIAGEVAVRLIFCLKTRRRVDCDNLSKGVLDSLKNICFGDDSNVVNLHIVKHVKQHPGVFVQVFEGGLLPPFVEGGQNERTK